MLHHPRKGERLAENQTLGSMIRAQRARTRQTQAQVGAIVGVNRSTVVLWENNMKYPVVLCRGRLAEWLGIEVEDLPAPLPMNQRPKPKQRRPPTPRKR